MTSAKMKFMAEKAAKRNAENKDTVFTCEGKRVPTHKIKRFLRRQKNEREEDTEHNETYPEEGRHCLVVGWKKVLMSSSANSRRHQVAVSLTRSSSKHAFAQLFSIKTIKKSARKRPGSSGFPEGK